MSTEEMEIESMLEGMAGEGFEELDSSKTGIPYLSVQQSTSAAVAEKQCEAGHFMNSLTKEDLGDTLEVIPVVFKTCWTERDSEGNTVARYEPGGVQVEGNVYDMVNPVTRNKVQETWMYLVLLRDRLQDGPMLFTSTPGNLKYLKSWNAQLKALRLPSGKPAPLFAYSWNLTIGPDVSKKGKNYFSFKGGISKGSPITQEVMTSILPVREGNVNLLEAPSNDEVTTTEGTDY